MSSAKKAGLHRSQFPILVTFQWITQQMNDIVQQFQYHLNESQKDLIEAITDQFATAARPLVSQLENISLLM